MQVLLKYIKRNKQINKSLIRKNMNTTKHDICIVIVNFYLKKMDQGSKFETFGEVYNSVNHTI